MAKILVPTEEIARAILILRGQGMREMWSYLKDGRLARASFNATYVSPGKVRTSQALAVSIGSQDNPGGNGKRGFAVIFETVPARS